LCLNLGIKVTQACFPYIHTTSPRLDGFTLFSNEKDVLDKKTETEKFDHKRRFTAINMSCNNNPIKKQYLN